MQTAVVGDRGSNRAAGVVAALEDAADAGDASFLQRFFKTGPGQYGEGDVFIGVRVPATRAVARRFAGLPLAEIRALVDSEVHEHRLAGLVILNARFALASGSRTRDDPLRSELVDFYLDAVRRGRVNNWDLVDASAEFVLGFWWFVRADTPKPIVDALEKAIADVMADPAAKEEIIKRGIPDPSYADAATARQQIEAKIGEIHEVVEEVAKKQ